MGKGHRKKKPSPDDYFSDKEKTESNEKNAVEAEDTEEPMDILCICEECDNRWDDIEPEDDEVGIFCPNCGSSKVIQM